MLTEQERQVTINALNEYIEGLEDAFATADDMPEGVTKAIAAATSAIAKLEAEHAS